jgi:hypothetical protein
MRNGIFLLYFKNEIMIEFLVAHENALKMHPAQNVEVFCKSVVTQNASAHFSFEIGGYLSN